MGLNKPFQAGIKQSHHFTDIGSKILGDFEIYKDQLQFGAPITLEDYMERLDKEDVHFTNMVPVDYKTFCDLHREKRISLIADSFQSANPGLFIIEQKGLNDRLRNTRYHYAQKDRLAMATLFELGEADYLYARSANIITYGSTMPMKSLVFKSDDGKTGTNGFVVFEPEFMKPYMEARQRAAILLESILPSPNKNSWRVPNTP